MREILFRGKRLDDGEWVEGSFVQCGEAHRFVSRPDLPFSDCYIFGKTDEDIVDSFGEETVFFNIGAYHIDPETVGQFTGLTDKNGKKIFEGDIIRAKIESGNHEGFAWPNMPVDFQKGSFCLNDRNGYVFAVLGAFAPRVTFEVIGNVHDNPELLQGGE